MSMTVLGVPQLLARFVKAAALGEVAASAAQAELGEEVVEGARARVRVETGALQDTIHYEDGRVVAGEGLPDIRALTNEYGTDNDPGQPYMRPAADTADGGRATEVAAVVLRSA